MDSKLLSSSVLLVVGVFVLSITVSLLTTLFLTPKEKPTTVIVERPWWNNYRGWWGYYGAGLPGWGGPKYPPRPSPHPKPPKPSPKE